MDLFRVFKRLSFLILTLVTGLLPAQNDLSVFEYWQHLEDPTTTLYRQIMQVAREQLEIRRQTLRALDSVDDYLDYQKKAKEKLHRRLMPSWHRTALDARITGRLERPDFEVEKIIFESFPGYPVSAAIFLPKRSGPLPAILFCSGHSDEGFRSPVYQHMILNYVKKGFVVLAFDPVGQGERNQYFRENGEKKFRPTHEHSYVGNQMFLSGISPAQFFVWDGIRAIDYLCSRPEVDPARIGVTGRSGGGTQTAYLMAVDDRIAAAAPECYLTTFEYLLDSQGPQDAEQNIIHFLKEGLDLPDLVAVRAPKPTMMVTTTRDIFSIQGARECYQEALPFFTSLNAANQLIMVEDDAPHQSTRRNREATYHFFQKFLENPGSPLDEEVQIFNEEELWVSDSGQLFKSGYETTLFSVLQHILKEQEQNPEKSGVHSMPQILKNISGYSEPTSVKSIFSGAVSKPDFKIEKYLIEINDDYPFPLVWLKPGEVTSDKVILYVDEEGKRKHADSTDIIYEWLSDGHQVVLADLSGYGEMGKTFNGDALIDGVPLNIWYAGLLTGKYPVAIRCEELFSINRFLADSGLNPGNIIAIGTGSASIDLLMASVLGVEYEQLILGESLLTLNTLSRHREYPVKYVPSLLPDQGWEWDLQDLIKASSSRIKLWNPLAPGADSSDFMDLRNYNNIPVEIMMGDTGIEFNAQLKKWIH